MVKYMGVCQLPLPNAKHRRIDIIVTPYSEVCYIMSLRMRWRGCEAVHEHEGESL